MPKLYEAFHATIAVNDSREYPDFADALKRHEQLSTLLSRTMRNRLGIIRRSACGVDVPK